MSSDGETVRDDDPSLAAYRQRARAWLAEHVPPGWEERLAGAAVEEFVEFQRWWLRELHSGGYAAPHWPRELGGSGATVAEQLVLDEEMMRAGAPAPVLYFVALNHTGATLAAHGTPEQRRHLRAILEDGEVWCQGFSEPGAGSDLASLRARAVRDGDCYVVNGQKVWSSMASHADWCLLLARTDPDAPKRKGISFFLLDMRSPGVEVRPIRQATGASEFCEIFLTDVVVPAANLVGAENDGWRVANTTLVTERGTAVVSLAERLRRGFDALVATAAETPLAGGRALDDAGVRRTLAAEYCEVEVLRALCGKLVAGLLERGVPGPEASVVKLFYSEVLQRSTGLGVDIQGPAAHLAPDDWARRGGLVPGHWLLDHIGSWAWTIGGGTSEIQRNLIGERVLGLPREPTPA